MRVAAYDSHTRERQTAFRTNYVDDTVFGVEHTEMVKTELLSILSEGIYLRFAHLILDRFVLVVGRGVMVGHTEDIFRAEAFDSATSHPLESLGACHLMAIEAVDVELFGSILDVLHHVAVPDFVKQSISHCFLPVYKVSLSYLVRVVGNGAGIIRQWMPE
jgi:hypothetical protein